MSTLHSNILNQLLVLFNFIKTLKVTDDLSQLKEAQVSQLNILLIEVNEKIEVFTTTQWKQVSEHFR